jgi:hypothetical protein
LQSLAFSPAVLHPFPFTHAQASYSVHVHPPSHTGIFDELSTIRQTKPSDLRFLERRKCRPSEGKYTRP